MYIVVTALVLIGLAFAIRAFQSGDGAAAFTSWAVEAVKPSAGFVLNLINSPAFVNIAAATLLLSAVAVIVLYIQRVVRPQMELLRRAEFDVAALPKPTAGDWRSAITAITDILGRRGALLSAWSGFAQDALDEDRLPPRRFAFYAQSDATSELNRPGGLMAALPSYYTSVGLILTFVGLVAALYFAARGFRSGDMNEARQSIIQLLNASAFKFLTSVAALGGAFMISICHRAAQSRLRHQAWRLLSVIDLHLQSARGGASRARENGEAAIIGRLDTMIAELSALRAAIEPLKRQAEKEIA